MQRYFVGKTLQLKLLHGGNFDLKKKNQSFYFTEGNSEINAMHAVHLRGKSMW